jgi:hypothetical protein
VTVAYCRDCRDSPYCTYRSARPCACARGQELDAIGTDATVATVVRARRELLDLTGLSLPSAQSPVPTDGTNVRWRYHLDDHVHVKMVADEADEP